jgi:hypothetical protein
MTRSRSLSGVVTVESLCSRGHIPVFVSCVQQPNALIIASCCESHSNTNQPDDDSTLNATSPIPRYSNPLSEVSWLVSNRESWQAAVSNEILSARDLGATKSG